MSGANPLVGLIGNYESGSDSEGESQVLEREPRPGGIAPATGTPAAAPTVPVTHPAPIPHCPWSACYDEGTGFTYYWHQLTNEVTWEAPPEYLLALKLASHQLTSPVQSEVTAEEWQLYQQALAEKQVSLTRAVTTPVAPAKPNPKVIVEEKINANEKKRKPSCDSEDEKIELITSYYHSDSDSNDEPESPVQPQPKPVLVVEKPALKVVKKLPKKQKTKPLIEYGPTLPPNQEYTVPIGPELPPNFELNIKEPSEDQIDTTVQVSETVPEETVPEAEDKITTVEEKSNPPSLDADNAESQDEQSLMQELLDKAKILQNLGGELPSDLKKLMKPESKSSRGTSPESNAVPDETSRDSRSNTLDTNIDDLLEEIEKKELPKILKPKKAIERIDMFSDDANFASNVSEDIVPKTSSADMPLDNGVKEEAKPQVEPLFPSSKEMVMEASIETIEEAVPSTCLFPSATSIETVPQPTVVAPTEVKQIEALNTVALEKKGVNIYIMSASEDMEPMPKKRKRISSNVLPAKKSEVPSYTTKYSQYIDGFSGERTGLGFTKVDEELDEPPKKTIPYGSYLKFTKGETLNEEKEQEDLSEKENIESLSEVLGSKLRFLNQQSILISPVQEMTIQMQTLSAAFSVGALTVAYWRGWLTAAAESLTRLEASAAPPGWICEFHREEGRYRYRREWDGHTQWEYPVCTEPGHEDMDISTTPPPPPAEPAPPLPPPPAQVVPPAPTTYPANTQALPAKKKRITPPPPPPPAELPPPPPPEAPPAPAALLAWKRPPPPPPPPSWSSAPPPPPPPPPPAWSEAATSAPSPPAWGDAASPPPPPPGCEDDHAAIKPPIPAPVVEEPKQPPAKLETLGDELMSFYSDIAELEKSTVTAPPPPEPEPEPAITRVPEVIKPPVLPVKEAPKEDKSKVQSTPEANGTSKTVKKKPKVKISAGMGMKQKTVSSLVAKWQQVQDEINSD